MPLKFTGRRKSSANILDTTPEPAAPAQSSFRVLDRVEKINLNGASQQNKAKPAVQRPFNSPLASLRGKSAEELGATLNRGSGGTTGSGGSSGYYESSSASARHSSSSTLPSSVDAEREPREDELFPKKTKTAPMFRNHAADIDELPPPPTKSFTSRAARALSFGPKHNRQGSNAEINHVPPIPPAPSWPAHPVRSHSPQRDRALTTSSYASTAKPEPLTLGADFGSDFGNIFTSSAKESPSPPPPVASQHKTVGGNLVCALTATNLKQESQPIYPPRTVSRNFATSRPSPDFLARERNDAGSPYSWDGRNSNEGLMTSSALSSPRLDSGPPVPPHKGGMAADFLRGPKAGYSLVPDRQSPGLPPERLSQDSRDAFISDNDKESEEDEYASDRETEVRGVQLRDTQQSQSASTASFASTPSASSIPTRKPSGMPSQAKAGASRAGAMSPNSSEGGRSLWASESMTATPKAERLTLPQHTEDSMFDSSPQGPPSRAIRPGTHMRTESGTPKRMTKAQFERLQRGDSSAEQSDEEHHSDDDYEDEDDAERAKKLARQRQKQEANMSVYRQQMKKVTGGGPSDLPSSMPRPSLDRASASAPAVGQGGLHFGGMGGQPPPDTLRGKQSDEDDDDVPLGILQAHGFPSGSRPPTRQEGDGMNQRRASAAGSVMGGGAGQGNLPPFARRLPADPYFGSSLVNQGARESMGFSAAPSVHGGAPQMMPQMAPQAQPQMGHPGGLVGVIAGEERAKAARRGSPNPATGTFNAAMPLPQNMPQMPRTMSMGNITAPQVYTPSGTMPGMPPMPRMPGVLPGMPGMPGMQMPQMPQMQSQDQMQKFMEMQMQIMQNMLNMQQVQMAQTPQPQQQQAGDYLGFNFGQQGSPSVQQGAPSIRGGYTPSVNQGRAMTMMNPPKGWDTPPGGVRPNSAMPATYAPSGYNVGGPGPGYTPSIAPTERSNVGMPSRYRPVETNGNDNAGRSQSMTSSMTLQAFGNNANRQPSPESRPQTAHENKARSSTVRLIDKPKGAPKVSAKPVADDEDEDGWAEMKKKREDKKRFRFGKKSHTESNLGDLYRSYD